MSVFPSISHGRMAFYFLINFIHAYSFAKYLVIYDNFESFHFLGIIILFCTNTNGTVQMQNGICIHVLCNMYINMCGYLVNFKMQIPNGGAPTPIPGKSYGTFHSNLRGKCL